MTLTLSSHPSAALLGEIEEGWLSSDNVFTVQTKEQAHISVDLTKEQI